MAVAEHAAQQPDTDRPEPVRLWARGVLRWPHYGWAGTLVAWLLAASSFTPSLLPRAPLLQGMLAGIVGAFGYGVGETLGWAARRLARRKPGLGAPRRGWRVLFLA